MILKAFNHGVPLRWSDSSCYGASGGCDILLFPCNREQKRRAISEYLGGLNQIAASEYSEIPEEYFKTLAPDHEPTISDVMHQAEMKEKGMDDFSIEPR